PPGFGQAGYGPRISSAGESSVAAGGIATTPHVRVDENAVVVEVGTTVDEAEKQLILKTLISTNNNKTRAAEILGITTKTLQNKLKEYASTDAAAASNAAGSGSVPDPTVVGAE